MTVLASPALIQVINKLPLEDGSTAMYEYCKGAKDDQNRKQGFWTWYNETGRPIITMEFKDNEKHGKYASYDVESGKYEEVGNFYHNTRCGTWYEYKNGDRYHGRYRHNKKHGVWIKEHANETGKETSKLFYLNGKEIASKEYLYQQKKHQMDYSVYRARKKRDAHPHDMLPSLKYDTLRVFQETMQIGHRILTALRRPLVQTLD